MNTVIKSWLMVCLIFLSGCGEGTSVQKLTGSGAGTILTSGDGNSWASQRSGTTNQLNGVTFGNGIFVAVGDAGTILSSSNGSDWTVQDSATPFNLYGVTSGNGRFVAVGDAGLILNSTNGSDWTGQGSATLNANPLNGVVFAGGRFVAVGYSGLMYSSDGVNWSSINTQSGGITGPTVDLYNVAYGNNLFVSVGSYNKSTSGQAITYDGLIGISPDGANWTTLPYTSNYLSGVTFGAGRFVAVGRGGSILISSDGTNWTAQTAAPLENSTLTPYLISVIYAAGLYVATGNYVGTNPSTGFILTSRDGINWVMPSTGSTDNLYGLCYGAGTFVAVGG